VLLHLIDGSSGSLLEDYKTICDELEAYGAGLADKERVIVLNKIDTLDEEERAFLKEELEAVGATNVLLMSGASGEGVREVLRALRPHVDARREADRPKYEDDAGEEEGGAWHP
jgi:GTP-binding protein